MKRFSRRKPAVWAALAVVGLMAAGCTIRLPQGKAVALETGQAQPERRPVYEHAGWVIARASLHNHTIYSDGCRSAEDLLRLAQMQGMAVLAYNDHREGKLCLGKRFCIQAGGVEQVGYAAYFEHLRRIQAQALAQGMIVLKGVEVSSPYMFNYGRFPRLVLGGQFRHFTVYAIEDPQLLERMPARREMKLKPERIPDLRPYQEFVDYIVQHGGIVHAVHVESGQDEWFGPVHAITPPPIPNLHLRNLTGFSILPEAWHEKAGGPGGRWDTVLLEYLSGMRERPLWASADADYHGPKGSLANATTLFYLREFSEPEIYRAMREGRMVALQGEAFQNSFVAEWWVSDSGPPKEAVMLGQEVTLKATPVVRFALDHPVPACRVRLLRNGRIIAEQEGSEITFADEEQGAKKEPAVYRVEVVGPRGEGKVFETALAPESELFVNPIFVRFAP